MSTRIHAKQATREKTITSTGVCRGPLDVPEERALDALRLARFRARHPAVVIETGEFVTWQARIPEPSGETIVVRHRLVDVLDKLHELISSRQA